MGGSVRLYYKDNQLNNSVTLVELSVVIGKAKPRYQHQYEY